MKNLTNINKSNENAKKYILAVDVGGTNTDSVIVDAFSNKIISKNKSFTTPDTTQGIINSIKTCIEKVKEENIKNKLLSITIGTTHFINAIL